jgi:hypothetical protein
MGCKMVNAPSEQAQRLREQWDGRDATYPLALITMLNLQVRHHPKRANLVRISPAEPLPFSAPIHRDRRNDESKGQSEGGGGYRGVEVRRRTFIEEVDGVPVRRGGIGPSRRVGSRPEGKTGGHTTRAGAFCQALKLEARVPAHGVGDGDEKLPEHHSPRVITSLMGATNLSPCPRPCWTFRWVTMEAGKRLTLTLDGASWDTQDQL